LDKIRPASVVKVANTFVLELMKKVIHGLICLKEKRGITLPM
jgi:hypothetical protein